MYVSFSKPLIQKKCYKTFCSKTTSYYFLTKIIMKELMLPEVRKNLCYLEHF